jgi:excisionase family DNA binding protein
VLNGLPRNWLGEPGIQASAKCRPYSTTKYSAAQRDRQYAAFYWIIESIHDIRRAIGVPGERLNTLAHKVIQGGRRSPEAERQSVQQPPAPQAPRQRLITVAEARQELDGISPTTFYQLVKDGELRVVKIGRRTFVAVSELDKYISRQIAS